MTEFKKAERKRAKLRLGISGTSGSGKTYSALLIAYGITGDWEKIALIDTERHSGELYAHLGGYSVAEIDAPYSPKKFIDTIHDAESAGFECIIVDSLSQAWISEGGMLDMADKFAAASRSGNTYTAWREVTPWHNKLIDAILQSPCHIIVTVRAKTEYALEDVNGKKTPKKIGLAPQFRDGLEYEMTTFFDISDKHFAVATKDRTELFDSQPPFLPSEETGKTFVEWLNSGAEIKPPICADCKKEITAYNGNSAAFIAKYTKEHYGVTLCAECGIARKTAAEEAEKQKNAEKQEDETNE